MAKRKGNIREIAQLCGVSAATVSRVINNKPDVSAPLRDKILSTIRELDYTPRVTVNPSNIIGLTLEYTSAFSSRYVSDLTNAIEDCAFSQGYDLLIMRNEVLRTTDEDVTQYLKRRMVSGLVSMLSRAEDNYIGQLAESGFPHVVISNPQDGTSPDIRSDCYQGMVETLEYLIEFGHRQIGFIHNSMDYYDHIERRRAYIDVLARHELPTEPCLMLELSGATQDEAGYQTANTLLRRYPQITALLVPCEGVMGVLDCLYDMQLKVPEDISIVAFDEEPWMRHTHPAITSLVQKLDQIGFIAVRELTRLMQNGTGNQPMFSKVLPSQLIVRESTGPAKDTPGDHWPRITRRNIIESIPSQ